MANIIKLKKSSQAGKVPETLEYGELALNYTDGKLYYKKSDGTIADYFLSLDGSDSRYVNVTGDTMTGALIVSNTIQHQGLVTTEGTNLDQVKSITKSITLTTDWQDTGIKGTDLATGTYIVQLYANDVGAGGTNSNEYYSGTMSWYSGDTNSSVELPTDEIILHRAGGSGEGGLYLRTYRTLSASADDLKLQIFANQANASASNYVFKFRRMI
jgi:hypothetical protein